MCVASSLYTYFELTKLYEANLRTNDDAYDGKRSLYRLCKRRQ